MNAMALKSGVRGWVRCMVNAMRWRRTPCTINGDFYAFSSLLSLFPDFLTRMLFFDKYLKQLNNIGIILQKHMKMTLNCMRIESKYICILTLSENEAKCCTHAETSCPT